MSTHGIDHCAVVRMENETEAVRRWRRELSIGNRVACLGTAPVQEVSRLRSDLFAV